MYPAQIAEKAPDRPAVVIADTAEQISYRQLADRGNQIAHLFRANGLGPGAHVAIMVENTTPYVETVWAAHISGIILTPVNNRLTKREVAYIINDSGAQVMIASALFADVIEALAPEIENVNLRFLVGGTLPGWSSFEQARDTQPTTAIEDECQGGYMYYSSGTTGRPKGIARPFARTPLLTDDTRLGFLPRLADLGEGEVVLVPGPLFHSAASNWLISLMHAGATMVLMQRFDAETALSLVERYKVTFVQFVPTHMIRLLRLPDDVRRSYDISSLKAIVHAAAPCPADVKRAMIDWMGPILHEYYSATEGIGLTWIDSQDWLDHPGSVGRALVGTIHILDDDDKDLPPGEVGGIYFEGSGRFEYHNDPDKTKDSYSPRGFATVGDMGYLDADGYLYLTDRRTNMIISGGMNIYPQEAENEIITMPGVADVAVIGIPHPEMGEQAVAVVQPVDWADANDEFAAAVIAHCRSRLAGYKCPRSVDFRKELPRTDGGKLLKRLLRDEMVAQGQEARS
jgi:long-chain acyl-CoA synthetase